MRMYGNDRAHEIQCLPENAHAPVALCGHFDLLFFRLFEQIRLG